ncbi:MAG TPA: class I SAM-dependent methyltransferase [Chthonomonadaceae bacterium]|nr:class I SAM-dependent methyltransferase [Chthonomonadaceae bacterium]
MNDPELFLPLAAAFVRGSLLDTPFSPSQPELLQKPLGDLSEAEKRSLVRLGTEEGLKLHKFKRTMGLPRVTRVLGILRGLQPAGLLDIGSGRGAFLWPLLDAFPLLPVMAVDTLDFRVRDIQAVQRGGIENLSAVRADVTALPFPDHHFDVVTMLEVLEHVPDTGAALSEVCRVAQRAVVLSVPSKPDDNPEHIHLFDAATLTSKLRTAGANRVNISHVLNHMVVTATL